ncbi:MAG: hypothetical protein KC474_01090 [Cyanobacteria bacterium HKST-UBA04]|nr:hypothetical protein [Cyanobacteria bacterium HKST-UBA04]
MPRLSACLVALLVYDQELRVSVLARVQSLFYCHAAALPRFGFAQSTSPSDGAAPSPMRAPGPGGGNEGDEGEQPQNPPLLHLITSAFIGWSDRRRMHDRLVIPNTWQGMDEPGLEGLNHSLLGMLDDPFRSPYLERHYIPAMRQLQADLFHRVVHGQEDDTVEVALVREDEPLYCVGAPQKTGRRGWVFRLPKSVWQALKADVLGFLTQNHREVTSALRQDGDTRTLNLELIVPNRRRIVEGMAQLEDGYRPELDEDAPPVGEWVRAQWNQLMFPTMYGREAQDLDLESSSAATVVEPYRPQKG